MALVFFNEKHEIGTQPHARKARARRHGRVVADGSRLPGETPDSEEYKNQKEKQNHHRRTKKRGRSHRGPSPALCPCTSSFVPPMPSIRGNSTLSAREFCGPRGRTDGTRAEHREGVGRVSLKKGVHAGTEVVQPVLASFRTTHATEQSKAATTTPTTPVYRVPPRWKLVVCLDFMQLMCE